MATTDIPVNANGTYDEPTWAESGSFSDSAYEGTGMPSGTLVGPNDFNAPRRHAMRWLRAMRDRIVWSDAGLYGSFLVPRSTAGYGAWVVAGLNGSISPVWVMIDADDDGGVVVPFYVSVASPHLFDASRDTYVNLDEDGLAEYQAVSLGDPPPTPTAGYVAVWKVITSGVAITSSSVLLSTIPVFKTIAIETLGVTGDIGLDGALDVGGDTELTGALTVGGLTTLNGSVLVGDNAADSCSFTATVTINNNSTIGSSAADTCTVNATLTINNDMTLGSSAADSITITGTVVAPVAVTLPSGSTGAMTCTGSTASALSYGGSFLAGHADAYALRATSHASGGATAAALYALASGNARAVQGLSVNGYAGHFSNDTSSPTRATLFIDPADNDPTTPTHGDLYHNGSRATGKLRLRGASAWASVHSSAKGHFKVWTPVVASGTEPALAANELAAVTTPLAEEVGDVLVTATGSITTSVDSEPVLITLYDTTSNSNVATQYWRAPDLDGAGVNRTGNFTIRGIRTLPSTVARTFVVIFGNSTDIDYANLIISAEGVQ